MPTSSILLATDGFSHSHAPPHVAHLLAERLHRPMHVVSVIEPVMYVDVTGLPTMHAMLDDSEAARHAARIKASLATTLPAGADVTVHVRMGSIAHEIADVAAEVHASHVVIGAAPLRKRRQLVSGVRAAQALRTVTCPVLSVSPSCDGLPRRIVAATDFSDASLRAVEEASRMLDASGTLFLVYTIPMADAERLMPTLADVMAPEHAMRLLERMARRVRPLIPASATIELRVLDGMAASAILEFAVSEGADLIAVGTHGPGLLERLFIGSVATTVLHEATCSVLASRSSAPESEHRAFLARDDERVAWTALHESAT